MFSTAVPLDLGVHQGDRAEHGGSNAGAHGLPAPVLADMRCVL
jgi:hypothetical protein